MATFVADSLFCIQKVLFHHQDFRTVTKNLNWTNSVINDLISSLTLDFTRSHRIEVEKRQKNRDSISHQGDKFLTITYGSLILINIYTFNELMRRFCL